jgi:glycosyltransferase involved in cell wall biosynthesis
MSKTPSNSPLISVIMPCHNAHKFIVEAMESILVQDFTEFELLVINDGSQDETAGLIPSFDDARIRYFEFDKRRGNCASKNFGIDQAIGKYIAFADADDISLPDRLSTQYNFLENHPDTYCIGSTYELLDAEGRNIGLVKRPPEYEKIKVLMILNGNWTEKR